MGRNVTAEVGADRLFAGAVDGNADQQRRVGKTGTVGRGKRRLGDLDEMAVAADHHPAGLAGRRAGVAGAFGQRPAAPQLGAGAQRRLGGAVEGGGVGTVAPGER